MRSWMRRAAITIVLPLIMSGVGCASMDVMQDKLYASSRGYNRAIRWADYDQAVAYIPEISAEQFLDDHEAISEHLVILDYEMKRLKFDRPKGAAQAQVVIEWHTDDVLVVKKSVLHQQWRWHEGRWYLVDERQISGDPIAFAPNREEEAHPYLPGAETFKEMQDKEKQPLRGRSRDQGNYISADNAPE